MTALQIGIYLFAGAEVSASGSQRMQAASPVSIKTGVTQLTHIATSFMGQCFMTPSDATSRLGRKAVWNVGGQDTDVNVSDFGNYFQLHLTGQAYDEEAYLDETWPQFSFITPDDSWKRLVTIEPQTTAAYRIAVGPSYQAVQSQPELVAELGTVGYDVFVGSNLFPHDGAGVFMAPSGSDAPQSLRDPQTLPIFPSFFTPDTSALRLFERYSVFDPDDLPTGGTQGTMFMGFGYLDFPPFTAEVDVQMPALRSPGEFAIDDFMMPSGRYTIPQDNGPIAYVSSAINAAKALRDLTLLQPKPTPVFSAGKPFIAGVDSYTVGQAQLDD